MKSRRPACRGERQPISALAAGEDLTPELAAVEQFPPLFTLETEYRLALLKAEHAFVTELIRRLCEEGCAR